MRFFLLLLLFANLGLGAFIYLESTKPQAVLPEEINRDAMKIVRVTDPVKASRESEAAKKLVKTLLNAECVTLAVKGVDEARVQETLANMSIGDKLSTRHIEEASRFAVVSVQQKDRNAAETVIASLKKQGMNDVSLLPDNIISMGVFSSEEAARRVQAEAQAKGVRSAQVVARSVAVKETQFVVREPGATLLGQLALLQHDIAGSQLKGGSCEATTNGSAAPPAAVRR